MNRTRMPEKRVLIGLLLVAGVLWILAEIQSADTDRAILMALRSPSDPADPIGPRWFEEVARDITALGSLGVLVLIITASVLFLFMARQRSDALMMLAATAGGIAATFMLKVLLARPRPDSFLRDAWVSSFSFPSGHTVMAAVTYLTLGALLARELNNSLLKMYVMLLAVVVTLLVGLSRIYLGVHWPTDVLGGWALGAAWALLCWGSANRLEKRRD